MLRDPIAGSIDGYPSGFPPLFGNLQEYAVFQGLLPALSAGH